MGMKNEMPSDDVSRGPFDLADPSRKSSIVEQNNKDFSQEMSQIVNG